MWLAIRTWRARQGNTCIALIAATAKIQFRPRSISATSRTTTAALMLPSCVNQRWVVTRRHEPSENRRAREREREEERETCFVHKQKKATGRKYLRDFERIDFPWSQGGTGVRWARNKKQVLTSPCSNLRSFGSKCTVLKKVLAPFSGLFRCHRWFGARGVAHPLLLLVTPLLGDKVSFCALFSFKILF